MVSFLEPEDIVSQLELRPDYHGAEFGCGPGGFVIPLAKKLAKVWFTLWIFKKSHFLL